MKKFQQPVWIVMSGTLLTHKMEPKFAAFIQARLGSHRLPRKVLANLPLTLDHSITILEHIYGRLIRVLPKDQIVFLIPDSDEELKNYILSQGWDCFSGDQDNVHDRFLQAGKFYKPDIILRLTGDNPFVDLSSIESILEAWIYAYKNSIPIDLVYVSPLPLGMGIESFSFDALIQLPDDVKNHHKEHVSIHIKENPSKFRIVKLPSGLDPNLGEIRMTIDEDKDFTTLTEISHILLALKSELGHSISDMGAKEIIECRNLYPDIFQKNKVVEQVRFNFPDINYLRKDKIIILVADPTEYGTGHYERMKILSSQLSVQGYKVSLEVINIKDFISLSNPEISENKLVQLKNDLDNLSIQDWIIVDMRDVILSFDVRANILYMDSYHPNRTITNGKNSQFFDLLPHPDSRDWKNDSSILVSDLIHSCISEDNKIKVLVYSGSLTKEYTRLLDEAVVKIFPKESILRIGTESTIEIQTISRLTKREWFSKLNSSKYFLSYFGQGLLEACYLGKLVASYSISDVHRDLSKNFESENGISYVGDIRNTHLEMGIDSFQMSKQRIQNSMTDKVLHILDKGRN